MKGAETAQHTQSCENVFKDMSDTFESVKKVIEEK